MLTLSTAPSPPVSPVADERPEQVARPWASPRGLRVLLSFTLTLLACGRVHFDPLHVDAATPPDAPPTGPDGACGPDAPTPPDAAVPDAAVPDAAVPDAAVPDAAVPDAGCAAPVSGPCAYTCGFNSSTGTTDCAAPVTGISHVDDRFSATIDMSGYTSLALTQTACDPTGWILDLGDSPTTNGNGGDGGSTSNDAELQVSSGTLSVWANDYGSTANLASVPNFVAPSGCTTFTLFVRAGHVDTCDGPAPVHVDDPTALTINPAEDLEGTPDALWYLGVLRTYADGTRNGTGVTTTTLCFR